ncbi:hypothetical protein [Streptomyces sp. NBC_00094]|uniref:hypothetical protein n=1 Tax=Streptomyces sp. NBC_00094 TaxID=2903620 RepID=UPI00224DFB12|nr:hypothetical protein [Streptomyces sp. NBC_00094]MCX5391288.1 hypothetical protein [Streptomyces sp. NBC_00094]
MTDDGRFGFLVAPLEGRGMFRFQLIVDSQLIGDTEPCILGTAMARLKGLTHLDDDRLGLLFSDRDVVLSALLTEEELHDRTTLSIAESLDGWLIHGYVYKGNVVVVARGDEDGSLTGPTLVAVVASAEYAPIVEAARNYWSSVNSSSIS